jgi:hypothetical protein
VDGNSRKLRPDSERLVSAKRGNRAPTDAKLTAIKANLFPESHASIGDWDKFPWHRDTKGAIDTDKLHSSQALAIDVFGSIKVSDDRDRILAALARTCGLPDDGPWKLELEWLAPRELLGEPRPTQVDAIALGQRAILLIECKFTEPSGACSQPNPRRGLRQCDGNHAMQLNPLNGKTARCALAPKGVRYWKFIPGIFGLDAEKDYRPCPFRGEAYQWMRNVTLAHALGSAKEVKTAVMVAYADASIFPTARKVRAGYFDGDYNARGSEQVPSFKNFVTPMTYLSIAALAQSHSDHPGVWNRLAAWVARKTCEAEKGWSQRPDRKNSPVLADKRGPDAPGVPANKPV